MIVWLRNLASAVAWVAGQGPTTPAADTFRTLLVRFSPEALADLLTNPVADLALTLRAHNQTDASGGATVVATARTGAGYLTISVLDPGTTAFIGLANVTDSTGAHCGMPITGGGAWAMKVADLTTIYATGAKVCWQVAS